MSGLNSFGYSYTMAQPPTPAQATVAPTPPTSVVLPAVVQQPTTTAIYAAVPRIKFATAAERKQSLEHIYDEIKYADQQQPTQAQR